MKKSFTILELILVILLLSILYTSFIPKIKHNNLEDLKNKITLQLKHLRFVSLIDSKISNEDKWNKKNWTLKFFRCKEKIGGFYYVIYSDKNKTGHPNQSESLKDPLSNKYIYSSNNCEQNDKNSKYVLLTKNFNIEKIDISCNNTNSLGQLSFSNDGNIYTKLSNDIKKQEKYKLNEECTIELIDVNSKKVEIKIENKTSYIY